EVWSYRWNAAGLLAEVTRPDQHRVRFTYDPFARRLTKQLLAPLPGARLTPIATTRFVWDAERLAHEIREAASVNGDPVVHQRTFASNDESIEPIAQADGDSWA